MIEQNNTEQPIDKDGAINQIAADIAQGRTLEDMRSSANRYADRKLGADVPKSEPTESGKAYLVRLAELRKAETDLTLSALMGDMLKSQGHSRRVIPYPVAYSDAYELFLAAIRSQLGRINKQLLIEPENEEKLAEMVKYFIGAPQKLDPSKGIYLCGAVGRGKTRIMEALQAMCNVIENRLEANGKQFTSQKFQFRNAKSIVLELEESKNIQAIKRYYTGILCIDDLGVEDGVKIWGNDKNVVGDIVLERYQRYQQSGQLTHATSNITPDRWNSKYGERVASRLTEMFNVVVLLGTDKRREDEKG